jgi:antitoxin (DNA-binding transcriptional repressor) of toxin-antitoxin stability system
MLTVESQEITISPRILASIRAGEAVFIEQEHAPFAILIPGGHPVASRPVGLCKGDFVVPDDFNEPLEIWDSLEEETSP